MVLKAYIFALLYGVLCLGLAFLAYKLGMAKNYTRKLVHILVGFEWVILYAFLGGGSIHFLCVCLIFTLLLLVTYFKRLTPMIASEGDNAPGTVYYGVAMSIMATVCLFVPEFVLYFGIGVFCTSFGDGFAGLVGQAVKKRNPKIYGNKSILGFLTNLCVSFAVPLVFEAVFNMGLKLWQCALIAFFVATLELISSRGLDNITVTLGAAFLSYSFIYFDRIGNYLVPIVLTPLIIAVVLKKKALTPFATVLAVFLDIVVSLTLGNYGFLLLLTFLVGSVLIDKIKKKKLADDGITKRGDCRDAVQVVANGIVPMFFAIFTALYQHPAFLVGYIAALSEAFADTAASGFGVFSKKTFDLFKWRHAQKGMSGGVSVIGTLSAFFASFAIPALTLLFDIINWQLFLLASFVAFVGAFFDTLLGSLVQVKYKCPFCGKLTEREWHCEKKCEKASGFEFFDNDVVNLFSGAFAAILATALCFIIRF